MFFRLFYQSDEGWQMPGVRSRFGVTAEEFRGFVEGQSTFKEAPLDGSSNLEKLFLRRSHSLNQYCQYR